MAYYLQLDGVDDYVQHLTPIPLVGHFRIEMKMLIGNTGIGQKILDGAGNESSKRLDINLNFFLDLDARTYCRYEVNGEPATSIPSYDEIFTLSIIRDATEADQSDKEIGFIGQRFSGTSRSEMSLYSLDVFDSSGSRVNSLDPSATNGTGLVLEDTVGGNNGTLVNFPTDDSQWVFYDAGGGGLVITSIAIASACLLYTSPSPRD